MADQKEMNKLYRTDLIGLLRKLGEKGLGAEIDKAMLTTDEIYGAEYLIDTSKKLVAEPRSYDLSFPSKLGKNHLIVCFKKMYRHTQNPNYRKAIEDYTNDSDTDVRKFAQKVIAELKGGS